MSDLRQRRSSERFGRAGERRVELHYRLRGYRLLVRNLRERAGEIDLIMRRGPLIVFIEVKSRAERWADEAAMAVDPAKRARIIGGARSWCAREGKRVDGCRFRYDVACVIRGRWFSRVRRWEGAFVDDRMAR